MASDFTQRQSAEEQRRAQQLSLQRTTPPGATPGYEPLRFLGVGAYGEVWVAQDVNTGREVAIKFFHHRSGVDWPLLSREVEKLVFLSADRYVVQLLEVGWEADPPYYVMEYVENGSLSDLLRERGALPVGEAVAMFREIAAGLMHAHGKGVLHCDLKPANILLDQDRKPRLADFGQSRLSHEQRPALGTLFYMAPEQADLEAVPDARWDVYALGALLYCMLTGQPPHRSEAAADEIETAQDLEDKLARYRRLIYESPPPKAHERTPGVDRALADIIDRCLAKDPEERFANVQEILDALQAREAARARRPLFVLGAAGPLLLLIVTALFGWRAYQQAVGDAEQAVTAKVEESNRFAARFVAGLAASEVERYFRAVEQAAADAGLRQALIDALGHEQLAAMLQSLRDPQLDERRAEVLRAEFRRHPARRALQRRVAALLHDPAMPRAASWFVCDAYGTQLAGAFDVRSPKPTIGRNYAYRSYCHGGPEDLPPDARPLPERHVQTTRLSALLRSTATDTWKVAVSTPLYDSQNRFLGVLALTLEVGEVVQFAATPRRFAVLVDGRPGPHQGVILQHPLYERMIARYGRLPPRFSQYRVSLAPLRDGAVRSYRDPLGEDEQGEGYRRPWIAAMEPVRLRRPGAGAEQDTGLIVIVQEDLELATGPVRRLGRRLLREAGWALASFVVVVSLLWATVLYGLGRIPHGLAMLRPGRWRTPVHEVTTRSLAPTALTHGRMEAERGDRAASDAGERRETGP